jgi:hypothetical protein
MDGSERQFGLWNVCRKDPNEGRRYNDWNKVYDDPVVQDQEEFWSLREHILAEYISLVDEERRESGQERHAIHLHSPHVPEVFPLREKRSAEVALSQE